MFLIMWVYSMRITASTRFREPSRRGEGAPQSPMTAEQNAARL
jgi:hypothetical protein